MNLKVLRNEGGLDKEKTRERVNRISIPLPQIILGGQTFGNEAHWMMLPNILRISGHIKRGAFNNNI